MIDYVIGIDIGTGSAKALAVNRQGKVITSSQAFYPTLHPEPAHCEQIPQQLWEAFVKCISQICSTIGSGPSCISLSTAMHSTMVLDEKGEILQNIIIWMDNRCSGVAQRIKNSAAGEMLYEQTGTPIHAMTPLCKILWLKENKPDLFKPTSKFISIKEYIWFRLFNCFEVDHSIASAEGLMDIEKNCWNQNALDVCGLHEAHLSILVPLNHKRNNANHEACRQLGILPETAFIIGGSDGCLANLGSFATESGIAALTIGTSGAVRVASHAPVHNFDAMTFNYRLDDKTFICGGPTNNGGLALKWFVENFLEKHLNSIEDYDNILSTLSQTKPGAEGLIFLPYLFGERAPIWNSDASGTFFGIRGSHTQSHFIRAVVEGITMALFDIADNMQKCGLTIKQINVSGGFVRSSHWLQILANVFNKKICLVNSDDASAMGAAFLALKAMNFIDAYNDLKPSVVKEILPQSEYLNLYQNKFLIYRNLYKSLRAIMISQNE